MPRYAYSWGDGNDGVSHAYPDGHIDAEHIGDAMNVVLAEQGSVWARKNVEREYGDGDSASLVWYEGPEGEAADHGSAYSVCDIWREEEE